MAKGWIITVSPKCGAAIHGTHLLVAIEDKDAALMAVQSQIPDAKAKVDCEANSEALEIYHVRPGGVFVLL